MGSMKSPTRIYIVEDSAAIRTRLQELLARMGGVDVVGEAASATEAIVDILALRPHSVLLDLNLGDRSGINVLRAIRPQAPQIQFVVLTNHAEPQYRRACEQAGAAFFLDKTTEFNRVPEVIATIASRLH
jgi:DNA-binding NarL/FixJ family response regulator